MSANRSAPFDLAAMTHQLRPLPGRPGGLRRLLAVEYRYGYLSIRRDGGTRRRAARFALGQIRVGLRELLG